MLNRLELNIAKFYLKRQFLLSKIRPSLKIAELLRSDHDEKLLKYAVRKWKPREYNGLITLCVTPLLYEPSRIKLALLASLGYRNVNQIAQTKIFIRLAQNGRARRDPMRKNKISKLDNGITRFAGIIEDKQSFEQCVRRTYSIFGDKIIRNKNYNICIELLNRWLKSNSFETYKNKLPSLAAQEIPIIYAPEGIISYAQNFEDVMLWRALWDVEKGFYIDVGAWDPISDSVSRAFYEKGWRGVHVEPLQEYVEKFNENRPDEKIYPSLLGAQSGELDFYYIPETGLSTAKKEFAERHRQAGRLVEKRRYQVITLAQIFEETNNKQIHWLKIDVEGMEDDVLAGWGGSPVRPWIVLLEATEPNTSKPTWIKWQYRLEQRGYIFSYFDGLNRFYIHESKKNLIHNFSVPPNVFDLFRIPKQKIIG